MTSPTINLDTTQQDAMSLMTQMLQSWGLGSLLPDLKQLIINGDTNSDTLSLALSQTQAYKQRFAANDIRVANGLPALSPAQYIATEEQYRNILQSYGLPAGFYDTPQDFTDFIAKDISPTEMDARAKIAHDQYVAAPDATKALWQSYGFSKGDAVAAILDPDVATSIIQDRAQQVAIGGAAAAQGFTVNQPRAQQFQQAGVTLSQAQQAYSQLSQSFGTDQQIAQRFGTTFDQTQEENSLLLNQGDAINKRQTLYDEEKSLFQGHGGADANTLGVSQEH